MGNKQTNIVIEYAREAARISAIVSDHYTKLIYDNLSLRDQASGYCGVIELISEVSTTILHSEEYDEIISTQIGSNKVIVWDDTPMARDYDSWDSYIVGKSEEILKQKGYL